MHPKVLKLQKITKFDMLRNINFANILLVLIDILVSIK